MKVYITGIQGFLGSHLAKRLDSQGHQVFGCDNLSGSDGTNLPGSIDYGKKDCSDYDALKIDFELFKPDVVYHTAAFPHEGLSVFSPHRITHSILDGTTAPLSLSCQYGVSRFIFCSSMARYGSQNVPFVESMDPKPQDPYAIAKVAAEEIVKLCSNVHGMEYVICVPHNIYGPHQKYNDPFRNVASIMLNRVLQGQEAIIYGDGNQARCFSYIDDVIDPLAKMIDEPSVAGQIINVGPDDRFITINQLARLIYQLVGNIFNPIYMPGRPQEVVHANCSADKARRFLGYEPKTSLEEGLYKLMEFIKEKGPKPFDYHLPIEIVNERTPDTWQKKLM